MHFLGPFLDSNLIVNKCRDKGLREEGNQRNRSEQRLHAKSSRIYPGAKEHPPPLPISFAPLLSPFPHSLVPLSLVPSQTRHNLRDETGMARRD